MLQFVVYCSPRFSNLSMRNCPVLTASGLTPMCAACTSLEKLKLDSCTGFNSIAFKTIADNCQKLRILSLNGCTKLVNEEYAIIFAESNLPSVQYIVYRCIQLEWMELHRIPRITSHFLHRQLRHRCPQLIIDVDEVAKERMYTLWDPTNL